MKTCLHTMHAAVRRLELASAMHLELAAAVMERAGTEADKGPGQ